jgi:signal transduction histidine kinase
VGQAGGAKQWGRVWRTLACLFCLWVAGAQGAAIPVDPEAPRKGLSTGSLSVWEDPSGEASLPEALEAFEAGAFRSLPGSLALGFKPGAAWLHGTLEAGPGSWGERWLELHPAYVDQFDLYHRGPDGRWQHRSGGDLLPQSVKPIPYRGHLLPLSLTSGRHEFFLRLASESDLAAAPVLWTPKAFQAFAYGLYWADGVLLGVAAAIAFLNAFIFLRRRTVLEGVFALAAVVATLQWSAPSGLLAEWIFPETPRWGSRAGGVLVCLYSASMWGFFMVLFEARRYHRVFYRIGQLALVAGLAGAMLTVLGFYRHVGPIIHSLSLVAFLLAPAVMLRLWRQGDVASRSVALAIGAYAIITLMIVLRNLGVLWLAGTEILARLGPLMVFLVAFQAALVVRSTSMRIALAKAQVEQAALIEERRLAAQSREDRARLLALLAHELRTPVAQIDSSRQVLELLAEHSSPRQHRHRIHWLDTLREAVAQLKLVFTLAVDLDDERRGQEAPDPSPRQARAVFEEALVLLPPAFQDRITLTSKASGPEVEGPPSVVHGIAALLWVGAESAGQWDVNLSASDAPGRAGVVMIANHQGPGGADVVLSGAVLPAAVLESFGVELSLNCLWPSRALQVRAFFPGVAS